VQCGFLPDKKKKKSGKKQMGAMAPSFCPLSPISCVVILSRALVKRENQYYTPSERQ